VILSTKYNNNAGRYSECSSFGLSSLNCSNLPDIVKLMLYLQTQFSAQPLLLVSRWTHALNSGRWTVKK